MNQVTDFLHVVIANSESREQLTNFDILKLNLKQ